MIPPGAISPKTTRVFLTLAAIHREHGRVTLDAIVRELREPRMSVHHHFVILREAGLIETGHGRTRPAVEPVASTR